MEKQNTTDNRRSSFENLARWFDSRLGLSHQFLRPVPEYAINPFYWLGALAVVAFVIEGITGMFMMLYYVPNPNQAYATTQYIFQNVSYGRFLETVHLYTAYAMIMLSAMHMMRGYFVSVYKKPRELTWIVGMIMGCIVLGMGFTGYLLPWTVVSKSGTDVGIGLISQLPAGLSSFLIFLMVGSGSDATVLLHFFDLHVVVLPAFLLILLVVKMYLVEAHGISEPESGLDNTPEKQRKLTPIFPDVSFYLFELGAMFGAAMLWISVIFPVNLGPEYTPLAASSVVSQPDWYFLWMYQILKVSVFEKSGLQIALSAFTLIFVGLFILPIIDRGHERSVGKRKKFATLGAIFVVELIVLSAWGYETPGVVISSEQAALVIGGTALIVALVSAAFYRLLYRGLGRKKPELEASKPIASGASINPASIWIAAIFVLSLSTGAFTISNIISVTASLVTSDLSYALLVTLCFSLGCLTLIIAGTAYLIYRLELPFGTIKRRVRAFEAGWSEGQRSTS